MAYQCPRCGGPVQRGSSTTAAIAGGALGSLLYAAFGSFQCKKCGSIPQREFPPEVRSQMLRGSVALVVGGLVLVVALIVVIALLVTSR